MLKSRIHFGLYDPRKDRGINFNGGNGGSVTPSAPTTDLTDLSNAVKAADQAVKAAEQKLAETKATADSNKEKTAENNSLAKAAQAAADVAKASAELAKAEAAAAKAKGEEAVGLANAGTAKANEVEAKAQEAKVAADAAKEAADAAKAAIEEVKALAQEAKQKAEQAAAGNATPSAPASDPAAARKAEEAKQEAAAAKAAVEEAKPKVEAAKQAADEAKAKAEELGPKIEEAKTLARKAQEDANLAKAGLEEVKPKIDAAKQTAEDAKTKADEAKAAIDGLKEKNDELKQKVNEALTAVQGQNDGISEAKTKAADALGKANETLQKFPVLDAKVDTAKEVAEAAKAKANEVEAIANAANEAALATNRAISELTPKVEEAKTLATEAKEKANEVEGKATEAKTAAGEATAKAEAADTKAQGVKEAVDTLKQEIAADKENIKATYLPKTEAAAMYQPKGEYVSLTELAEKIREANDGDLKATDADAKYATKAEIEALNKAMTPEAVAQIKKAIQVLQDNPDLMEQIAKKANADTVYTKEQMDHDLQELRKLITDLETKVKEPGEAPDLTQFVKLSELSEKVLALVDLTPYLTKEEAERTYLKKVDLPDIEAIKTQLATKLDESALQTVTQTLELLVTDVQANKADVLKYKQQITEANDNAAAAKAKAEGLEPRVAGIEEKQEFVKRTVMEASAKADAAGGQIQSIREFIDNLHVPEVSGFATKKEVAGKADKSQLEALATKEELGAKANASDLTSLATKEEVAAKANASDLTSLATKEEVAAKANASDLTSLATKEELQAKANASDLTSLATKEELATKANASDLTPLATKEEVNAVDTKATGLTTRVETLENATHFTKAEADEAYQPKGEYALKSQLDAIAGLDSATVEKLKAMLTDLEANGNVAAIVEKLGKVYTKEEANGLLAALATKEEIADVVKSPALAALKQELETAIEANATKEELAAKANASDLTPLATKEELTAKAQELTTVIEAKATKEELAAKANASDLTPLATKEEVNTKAQELTTAIEAKTTLDAVKAVYDPKIETINSKDAEQDAKIQANTTALEGKANTSALETLATKEEVAGKADKSQLLALATKEELALKADAATLSSYLTGEQATGLYAPKEATANAIEEVKRDVTTIRDTTIDAKVTAKLGEELPKYQLKGNYVTRETADATYQPIGQYVTTEKANELHQEALGKAAEAKSAADTVTNTVTTTLPTLATKEEVGTAKTEVLSSVEAGYVKKTALADYVTTAKHTEDLTTKETEIKAFAEETYLKKSDAKKVGLTEQDVDSIVDNKLVDVKEAVKTVTEIKANVGKNQSSVEGIIATLSEKASKEETKDLASKVLLNQTKEALEQSIQAQVQALAEAKQALEQAISSQHDSDIAAFQTKADFATWLTDTYTAAINQIKTDMMTAEKTGTAIDEKLKTFRTTLDSVFQPIGDYITREEFNRNTPGYITKTESDRLYQGIGNYATATDVESQINAVKQTIQGIQSAANNALTLDGAKAVFALKGDYFTRADLETIAKDSAFATVINQAIASQNFLDSATAESRYQRKGNFATKEEVQQLIDGAGLSSDQSAALAKLEGFDKANYVLKETYDTKVQALQAEIDALKSKPAVAQSGAAATRPSQNLVAGQMFFNTDTKAMEYYDGTQWVSPLTATRIS
jgi:chromosome segregation ATPase